MPQKRIQTLVSSVARGVGLGVVRFRWHGTQMLVLVAFPGGWKRWIWVVRDPSREAFASGAHFAIGDRPVRRDGSDRLAPNPSFVEAFMRHLLGAFEARAATLEWPLDMLFGDYAAVLRLGARCNEACIFCNTTDDTTNFGEDLETARQIARGARTAGVSSLAISGGEPLLVPWLCELLEEVMALGFDYVLLQTNGTLLSQKELLDRLEVLRPVLQVSLHAAEPRLSGELTRAPGLWESKIEGIKAALARAIPLNISCVVSRKNMLVLDQVVRFVGSLEGLTV